MLLSVDIGNSTIGLGLFREPAESDKLSIKKIPTGSVKSAAGFGRVVAEFLKAGTRKRETGKGSTDVIISSVVPSLDRTVIRSLRTICGKEPLIVGNDASGGLAFDIPRPQDVGTDRIANAVAAFRYYGKPVAVVDFGTATTITVTGGTGNFLGGAILPGLGLMQKALYAGTAKLPAVTPGRPETVLGRDTRSSIVSGTILGTAGAVEALVRGMEKELGFRLKLLLTGGHAGLMASLMRRGCRVHPHLTLEGLRLIYLKDREGRC